MAYKKRKYTKKPIGTENRRGKKILATRKSTRFLGKQRVFYSKKGKKKNEPQDYDKLPYKAPASISTQMHNERIYFRGVYYRVGDIVGITDSTDGQIYYAQIRGFLNSQYSEKSAIITWLLPSTSSPEFGFDPSTYFLGPEEDTPRKLECMQFVCTAPSDYFRNLYAPYRTLTNSPQIGFVWNNNNKNGGQICRLEDCEAISTLPQCVENVENRDEKINIDDEYEPKKDEYVNTEKKLNLAYKKTNITDVD